MSRRPVPVCSRRPAKSLTVTRMGVSLEAMAKAEDRRETDSGHRGQAGLHGRGRRRGRARRPGEFPFTRGPYPDMYRGRPWTMRQYAGFASAEETNARFRYLLERGQTGLSVAFDLPTQIGLDSDDARAAGEVGRTGVAIDSLADMEILFDGIPLDEVSTSMTINATAALLLLLYELVAEGQGVAGRRAARHGPERHPQGVRGARDLHLPAARRRCGSRPTSSPTAASGCRSGTRSRSPGTTSARRARRRCRSSRFTLAHGIAYCQAAVDAGLSPDEFGERLSFFFNAHNHFFQEVAKFRAARTLWARIMQRALRRHEPEGAGAPLPRADGRLDADRAAAGEQHRARRDPGALGRLRRRAVHSHERLRRGAGASRPSGRRASRSGRSR